LQHQVAVFFNKDVIQTSENFKKAFLGEPNVQELQADPHATTPCAAFLCKGL